MKSRFLVVDDHPVFRQGLVALIESNPGFEVVAEAGDVEHALSALSTVSPDIALVDISLQNENGLDLVRRMRGSHPGLPVLIITMHDEIVYAQRVMKTGARGIVMKQEAPDVILKAIQTVLSGRVYLSEQMSERLLEAMFTPSGDGDETLVERLSERELEVLEYIGQGYGMAEIAGVLTLSVKTVHTYRDHLKEKLQLDSAAELRRFAVKWYQSLYR